MLGVSFMNDKSFLRRYRALIKKAGKQDTDVTLSLEEAVRVYKSDCYYCGCHPSQRSAEKRILLLRKDHSKPYSNSNTIACCRRCHSVKGARSHTVFKAYLGAITAKTLAKNGLRVFFLQRHQDVHGVSGTGKVAVAIEFPSKKCVMEWLSKYTTETVYENIQQIEDIHGHEGRTVLAFKFDAG